MQGAGEFTVKLLCVGVAAAFSVAGCGTWVDATPLNAPPHALSPRAPESVEIYASGAPSRPHVDVALLRADQVNRSNADMATMMRKLRVQAAKMGCDAIVVSGATEQAGAPTGSSFALLDPGTHSLLATCLAYLPASGNVP